MRTMAYWISPSAQFPGIVSRPQGGVLCSGLFVHASTGARFLV
jgi:hypothetical protein